MRYIFLVVILFTVNYSRDAIESPECPFVCNDITCNATITKCYCEKHQMIYKEKGTFCGCCPACLRKICKC